MFTHNVPGGTVTKNLVASAAGGLEMCVWSLGWKDLLEAEMTTHCSILAWKIPWIEDSGWLQSKGSQRIRHDWAHTHVCIYKCILFLFSRTVVSNSLWPHGLQHARLPCPSLSPIVCSNSCPLSQWYYLTISSSAVLFFCLQSFPASVSFPVNQLSHQVAQVLELEL